MILQLASILVMMIMVHLYCLETNASSVVVVGVACGMCMLTVSPLHGERRFISLAMSILIQRGVTVCAGLPCC